MSTSDAKKERKRANRKLRRQGARAERDHFLEIGLPMAAFQVAEKARMHPNRHHLHIMLERRPTSPVTTYAWLALNRSTHTFN